MWFWGFWGSLAPYLVGKYIIPGSLATPISHGRLVNLLFPTMKSNFQKHSRKIQKTKHYLDPRTPFDNHLAEQTRIIPVGPLCHFNIRIYIDFTRFLKNCGDFSSMWNSFFAKLNLQVNPFSPTHSLKLTVRPWKQTSQKERRSYSNHPFSGAKMLVSGRVAVPIRLLEKAVLNVGYLLRPLTDSGASNDEGGGAWTQTIQIFTKMRKQQRQTSY